MLALWELARAHEGFHGSGLYTRLLDTEVGHLDWEALEEMPAILLDRLVSARNGWSTMMAAEEEARKSQPTLFEFDDQP